MKTSTKTRSRRSARVMGGALTLLLSALLSFTGCSAGQAILSDDDVPLSDPAVPEQVESEDTEAAAPEEELFTQTLDNGIVVSSEELDVSDMDITVKAKEVSAPEVEVLSDEYVNPDTSTGYMMDPELLSMNMAQASAMASAGTPSTVGGLMITGGTVNTDFTHAANLVVVKTSTPLTLSGTFTGSVQIASGVEAWVTLNGVTITANSASSPINLMKGAKAHIILADGTTNTLNANQQGCAALHCGDGSYLWVDDAVVNYDFGARKHIGVYRGVVNTDGTVTNLTTGETHDVAKGDILASVTSKGVVGKLIAKGGKGASGIGAGPKEVAGDMTFDGGYIEAYSWGGHSNNYGNSNVAVGVGVTNAEGTNVNDSSGTGIGGGAGGGGATNTTFNSGIIYAYGSYHGAGIGAGWSSAGSLGAQTGASSVSRNANNAGNININGGYIMSQGYCHGNAFGGACGTNLSNSTVHITGGTLRPFSHNTRADIGGTGGYVIIEGGSITLTGAQGSKFQSSDNKAYSDTARKQEVVPVEVDLAAQTGAVDYTITNWALTIDGKTYDYGAPYSFNAGKLCLWLPPAARTSKVEVQLNYYDEKTGSEVLVEPLYREANSTSSTVKRNVYFDLPVKDVFGADVQTTDVKLPSITNFPNELLVDNKIPESVNALVKEYDGLPFETAQINDLTITESKSRSERKLSKNELVTYSYRLLNGNTFTDELSGSEMPRDTGLMAFAMNSTEYADYVDPVTKENWGNSYIGHRSNGWVKITPVPAILTIEGAEWGYLDAESGEWTATTSKEDTPGNRIKITMNLRSAIGTMPTCKVPTGRVQMSINGKEFGDPITLTKEWIEQDGVSTYTVQEGPDDKSANTPEAIKSAANRWTAYITYYMDPAQADGFLNPRGTLTTSNKNNTASPAAADDGGSPIADAVGGLLSIFSDGEAQAAYDDIDESKLDDNEYKLSGEYLPDKNYVEGVEANPQNADATATIIIPVDPKTALTDDQGDTYEETEIPNPDPAAHPDAKYMTSTVTKSYSDFHMLDKDGNETKDKDYFTLRIEGESAMPMEWTSSDPAVADVMRDENGNVIYDENGDPKVQVFSCGKVTLTMHQDGNAIYNEQTHTIEMTVIPDPSLKPETEARVIMRNLTHPGMPPAPGDELEYTVVGTNYTDGSSWQSVDLGSIVDPKLTVNEGSITVAKNFITPEDTEKMTSDDLDKENWEPLEGGAITSNPDGTTSVSGEVGSVYGGQSTAIRFTVTVTDNTPRSEIESENPPRIPNEPTASGSYGVRESSDLVPGVNSGDGDPIPVEDTELIGIPKEAEPEAALIPRDPKMSGDDADMFVNKTAENLDRQTGITLPGDKIRYNITVGNKTLGTCLYWPVIHDTLPVGVTPVPGSFELVRVDGSKQKVDDKVFVEATHAVALYVDHLYGGEETTLTFECTVGDNASYVENTAQVIGTDPSDKWRGEHPTDEGDDTTPPVVPDPKTAEDILGGTLDDDPAGDDTDPAAPGVPVKDITDPEGPLANAKKADPADPTVPALTDPTDPDSTVPDPILPGDRIVKFGDKEDPKTPQDIADEMDKIIKEQVKEDPETEEVDIPVTIERPDPTDPTKTITENVIITVPVPPEMKNEILNPTTPDPVNPPTPGEPWTPDPKIPTDEYPWDDFDWKEYVEKTGTEEGETPEPATPGTLIPARDPKTSGGDTDLKVVKTAQNLKSKDGNTYVGDRVKYTIEVSNDKEGTCWFNAIVRDDLPKGLDIDMSTAKVITHMGQVYPIESAAYNQQSRILAVNIGDVPGKTSVKVEFEAVVSADAIGSNVGNSATAYGTPPSKMTPDMLKEENRPAPGTAFNPPNGWDEYDRNNDALVTDKPAYPSEKAEKDGVQPAENPDDVETLGNGDNDGKSGAGNDNNWSTVASNLLKLAQTGDPLVVGILSFALVAAVAGSIVVVAAVRSRRHDDE